jgi:hypothetical protein
VQCVCNVLGIIHCPPCRLSLLWVFSAIMDMYSCSTVQCTTDKPVSQQASHWCNSRHQGPSSCSRNIRLAGQWDSTHQLPSCPHWNCTATSGYWRDVGCQSTWHGSGKSLVSRLVSILQQCSFKILCISQVVQVSCKIMTAFIAMLSSK